MTVRVERPKPETTKDGRIIVYPIWRDDFAEAIIQPKKQHGSRPQ